MIEVRGFTKAYGERIAVRELAFSVGAGEIVGLLGPNGAGKTTTLRSLAGILRPSAGSLGIGGFDVVSDPLEAKRRLALVADDPPLFSSLTVWEHLVLTAQLYDLAGWEERAGVLLAELELAERRDDLAEELSRGMRQKVCVACALLHEPLVLLLDEPLTGLDPRGIRTLYAALRRRAAAGAAIVVSSHLLAQIEALCTRFLLLHEGRLLLDGSKREIALRLPALRDDVSLEEIFFEATERPAAGEPS
jgi:ABC-2 type transport system ATP-binding protein